MATDRRVNGVHLAQLLGDWRAGRHALASGLAGRLRLLVLDGRLPLNTRVPAERELAEALGVSRTTAAAAYERLRADGFLHSRRGAGTWTHLPPPVGRRPAGGGPARGGGPAATLAEGTDVVDLAHASPAAPATWLRAAVERAVTELTRYLPTHGYEPAGIATLRAAVADRFAARGLPTRPEEVMVTAGAQQAFGLVLRTLASPGDRVVVEHPTYPNALDAIRRAGCRPVPVAFAQDRGTAPGSWDLEMLAATIRHSAPRLVYLIADFQNPTGLCMDRGQRQAVVELARRSGTLVVVDETLADLGLDVRAPEPVASHDEYGTVLTTGSMSKTFWGGLRTGWLRAPAPVVRQVAAARASADLASPVLEQLVAAELVPNTPQVAAERCRTLTTARDHLLRRLADRLPDWRATPPPGGLALWVDLGAPVSSALTIAAERHGVALAAGPRFGLDGAFERYLRLPYTLDLDALDTAVERLAAAYASLAAGSAGPPPVRDVA